MRNKYLSYSLIIIIVIMLGYIVVLKNKAVESTKLISQVNLQNQQLEEIKNRELGARNMIPQYISDTNSILDRHPLCCLF